MPERDDGPSTHPQSVESARKEARQQRSRCANLLHYACGQLCRPRNVRLWALLAWGPKPLEDWFNDAISKVKTIRSTQSFMVGMVKGAIVEVGVQLYHWMLSPELAQRLQLFGDRHGPRSDFLKDQDSKVVGSAVSFFVTLIGELAELHYVYQTPPFVFLEGAAGSAGLEAWLAKMKKYWRTLSVLEEAGMADLESQRFAKNLVWTCQQWPREILLQLYEADFAELPRFVKDEIAAYSASYFTTLGIEQLFNANRRASSANMKGQREPIATWHHSALGCSVLEDFGRPSIGVTGAARSCAAKSVPQSYFVAEPQRCSLGDADLDTLTSARRQDPWPATSPDSLRNAGMAWQLALATKGDAAKISKAHFSLLMIPGCVAVHSETGQCRLILHACQYGSIAIRTPLRADRVLSIPPIGISMVSYGYVEDPSLWRVAEAMPLMPGEGANTSCGLRFAIGQATSLLK